MKYTPHICQALQSGVTFDQERTDATAHHAKAAAPDRVEARVQRAETAHRQRAAAAPPRLAVDFTTVAVGPGGCCLPRHRVPLCQM